MIVNPNYLPPCLPQAGMADTTKTIASAVAIPLAIVTFWLGYRQRERERTRGYYHKVVVDVLLPDILAFFDEQTEAISEAGRQAEKGLASMRKTLPRTCTISLSDFSAALYKLLDKISERTLIFDEKITSLVVREVDDLEDSVTGWFNDIALFKRRNVEELAGLMKSSQRNIVKLLYKGEFRDF